MINILAKFNLSMNLIPIEMVIHQRFQKNHDFIQYLFYFTSYIITIVFIYLITIHKHYLKRIHRINRYEFEIK
jgi:hypothetical protein